MLDTMRSMASGFIAKALLLFLVVTFAVWGIGDIFSNTGPTYAARVGNATISVGEFEQSKAVMSRQMQAMGIQGADANKLGVGILRQLVQQRLILQASDDLGLSVSDDLLMKSLKVQPQFQTLDGQFSASAFKATLSNLRMSEAQFLAQLKNETAGKFLLASLDMSDVTTPASFAALATAAGSEVRDIATITIVANAGTSKMSDADIESYYDQNKTTLYMDDEKRMLEYVTLASTDIDALVDQSITADMLKSAATAKPGTPPEKLRNSLREQQRGTILRKLSNEVEDGLAAGITLGEAIAKAGVKATSKLVGDVTGNSAKAENDDILKTVKQQGMRLSEGEISGIITTPKGATLMVSVKSVMAATPKKLNEVMADVKSRLAKQLAREAASSKATEIKEALNKDADWQAVTARFQLTPKTISNVARPSDDASTTSNSQIPLAMQQAIFEREVGKTAGPLTLNNGDQMLAVVLASRHVTPAISDKTKEKVARQMADSLNQTVQSQAFNQFAARHKVEVNPKLLTNQASDNQ